MTEHPRLMFRIRSINNMAEKFGFVNRIYKELVLTKAGYEHILKNCKVVEIILNEKYRSNIY